MSELHFKPGKNLVIEEKKGEIIIEPVKEETKLIDRLFSSYHRGLNPWCIMEE